MAESSTKRLRIIMAQAQAAYTHARTAIIETPTWSWSEIAISDHFIQFCTFCLVSSYRYNRFIAIAEIAIPDTICMVR